MTIRKLIPLLLVSTILVPAPRLFASGVKAADFLKISVGARPAGMGEAFVAVADETSGIFYNPAGAAFFMSPELQAMHSLWLGDMYYSFLGFSYPTMAGTMGVSIQYLSGPSTTKLVDGVSSGDFSYYDAAANATYATRIGKRSSMGVTLRSISSKLDTNTASAFTGDAGLMFRTPEEGFSFGISGQNLFGQIGEEKLPMSARLGMALKASLPEHYSDVLFSVEAGQAEYGPLYYAAGIEHWGARTLGLRTGYKYIADEKLQKNMDALSGWRAGMSLRLQDFAVDYAYQPFAALGAAHRISFTWRMFGWQAKYRIVSAQVKADPAIFSPDNNGAKDSTFFVPQAPEIKDVKSWELVISDEKNKPVKKFSGKDIMPKILSWEGQRDGGAMIGEGKYSYVFSAIGDGRKMAKSVAGEIVADLTTPEATLAVSTYTFAPRSDGLVDRVTFYIAVNDAYGVDQWQLSILNTLKRPVKVIRSISKDPAEIVWDGTDDYYNAVVPNGAYEARLIGWDVAGNKTTVLSKINVFVPAKVEVREVVKEIQVREESRGLVVNLSSQILFAVGKSVIRPEAYKSLDEVAALINAYPENDVLVEGHTDSTGSRARNLSLSSERAWAIYSYLVKHGVPPARLKPKGYGPERPVASNKTAAARAKNRRVEIIILKK